MVPAEQPLHLSDIPTNGVRHVPANGAPAPVDSRATSPAPKGDTSQPPLTKRILVAPFRGAELKRRITVTSPRLRWIFAVLAAVAPQRVKHVIYRRVFGWDIHPTAYFGLSLINVEHLSAAEGVIVTHLNVIKACDEVRLGARAIIGPMNWITAPPRSAGLLPSSPDRRPRLELGDDAAITSRHIVYCSDEVMIEPFAILGGLRSQIITHGPDYVEGCQRAAPVRIGHHSIVATSCTLLAGSSVAPRSIVAGGSTVPGQLTEELTLYGGTPARKLKDLPEDAALFHRPDGYFF
jgi:acetyltransferase-like isoleucine patch superfamily enzyme